MRKVSIIGLGWLGSSLAHYLQSNNVSVIGSNSSNESVEASIASGLNSILFNTTLDSALRNSAIHRLFDCRTMVITLPPRRLHNGVSYADAVGAIAKTAESCGAKHIIFTSSTSVYGPHTSLVDELSDLNPQTESAKAIILAEQELLTKINVNVSIVRLGGLLGGERLPKKWMQNKEYLDRPYQRINLIHRNDAIIAISEIIKQGGDGKQIYNIVSPEHPTRLDFYNRIAKDNHLATPKFLLEADDSQKHYGYVCGSKLTDKFHVEYQHSIYLEFGEA